MSYPNVFLTDFTPVFKAILKEKGIVLKRLELVIIDEEPENYSTFEPADVGDVLYQLGQELNALAIYTDRPEYFEVFAKSMFEENGLVVMVFPKQELKRACREGAGKHTGISQRRAGERFCHVWDGQKLILDFEWNGDCYYSQMGYGKSYIPIHKRPWEIAENLDIIVPFGYNTLIVKNIQTMGSKTVYDRYDRYDIYDRNESRDSNSRSNCYDRFEEAFYSNE